MSSISRGLPLALLFTVLIPSRLTGEEGAQPALEFVPATQKADSRWKKSRAPVFSGKFGIASDPAILRDGDLYRMYHTGLNVHTERTVICQAVSKDGFAWSYEPQGGEIPGVVLEGKTGQWDENLEGSWVVKKDDGYLLYYSGYREKGTPAKGFPASLAAARSPDGIQFTRVAGEPILKPTPGWADNDAIYGPTIIRHKDHYVMIYAGHCYTKFDKIGRGGVYLLAATSPDGLTWTRHDKPLISPGDGPAWMADGAAEPGLLAGPDGKFYLFFTGLGPKESRLLGLAVADSPLGPWRVEPDPIVTPTPDTTDELQVLAPCVLLEGQTVRMWYLRYNAKEQMTTGYAEASWPLLGSRNNDDDDPDYGGGALKLVRSPKNPLRNSAGADLVTHKVVSDPCMLLEDGRYRMWFTTVLNAYTEEQVMGIAYAESDDGLAWKVRRDPRTQSPDLIVKPTPGSWDAEGVETCSVVRTSVGKYVLFYTGDMPPKGSDQYAIGMATSDDGIVWKKHEKPVLTPQLDWEQPFAGDANSRHKPGGVLEPSVVYDEKNSMFRMWYAALGMKNGVPGFRIGHATSKDSYVWTREAQPVFEAGATGAWDDLIVSHTCVVPDPKEGYHLFYFGSSARNDAEGETLGGTAFTAGAIGHAFSRDGLKWTRDLRNPVLSPVPKTWEAWTIGGPTAAFIKGKLNLWYFGSDRHDTYESQFGHASSE